MSLICFFCFILLSFGIVQNWTTKTIPFSLDWKIWRDLNKDDVRVDIPFRTTFSLSLSQFLWMRTSEWGGGGGGGGGGEQSRGVVIARWRWSCQSGGYVCVWRLREINIREIPQTHISIRHSIIYSFSSGFRVLFFLSCFSPFVVSVLSFFWHPTCLTLNASPYNAYVMRLSPLGILCFGYHTQNTRHDPSDLNSCDVTIYLFLCCLQIIFHFFLFLFHSAIDDLLEQQKFSLLFLSGY